jgi:hypothetical protein
MREPVVRPEQPHRKDDRAYSKQADDGQKHVRGHRVTEFLRLLMLFALQTHGKAVLSSSDRATPGSLRYRDISLNAQFGNAAGAIKDL